MSFVEEVRAHGRGFKSHIRREDGFEYSTDEVPTPEAARSSARSWINWAEGIADGEVESVYYIVSVPFTWVGPPRGCHRYSGLRVKIGRAHDVLKRLANLRTGTADDLIIHALEPGSAHVEAQRHREFASDRVDQGREWFSCSPRLMEHVWRTWKRNNLLPRVHQMEVVRLQERIDMYALVRDRIGQPDLVNPGLNEPWNGKVVFQDLAYRGWRVSIGKPLNDGAIEIPPPGLLMPHEGERRSGDDEEKE